MSFVIDSPLMQAAEDVDSMTGEELLVWANLRFADGFVMTTSFGIQSAVTLHLATQILPGISVTWVDTGYLPQATYDYANTLTDQSGRNGTSIWSSLGKRRG